MTLDEMLALMAAQIYATKVGENILAAARRAEMMRVAVREAVELWDVVRERGAKE